ncbi:MAG: hypothetical protein ACMVO5_00375 [Polymorphobacter sp.]|uniref:hypothetical protein n=1 Tax=Polymorphobacter sp. TaxID=1909290 RepID=UPI003A89FE7C
MLSLEKIIMTGAVAALMAGSAQAALVVRSVGNGAAAFPVGQQVMPGTPIKLGAGDMLTLLDGQTTRTFRGPGTYDLGQAAQATTTLAAATSAFDARTAARKPRLGTVRGIPKVDGPSLWDVDLSASGEVQCIVDPANVTVRRDDTSTAAPLTIAADSGKTTTLSFEAGKAALDWPDAMPAAGKYTLKSGSMARSLTFATVPSPTGDAATDAAALIKAGCMQQLERFVATLEGGASPAGGK